MLTCADVKAAATAALKPALDKLAAAKKLVEEAETAAANVGYVCVCV
jgi:hypothetical protein